MDSLEPAVYTAEEMAQLLQVGITTIYRRAAEGDLPHIRFGRRLLFPKNKVTEWLAQELEEGDPHSEERN